MQKKIIILSGELMERSDIGVFVIDPETVTLHKPRLICDYNHNEEEIIGFIDNIRAENGKLVGDMTLESTAENDRAAEIITRIESGTPYEFSPTVMLDESGVVAESATLDDGTEYTIFRCVPLRGVSVCPFGTDRMTTILSLSGGQVMRKSVKSKKLNKKLNRKLTKMAADEILDEAIVESEVIDEAGGEEGEGGEVIEYTAYPLLEQFIQEFGFELGVEYFRRGYTLEEAQAADYAQLKAARLAAEEDIDDAGAIEAVEQIDDSVPEAEAEAAIVEEAQEAVEEAQEDKVTLKQAKTTLKANIILARQVRALAKELMKLKAVSIRGTDAVKSTGRKEQPLDAVHKYARKIHNR